MRRVVALPCLLLSCIHADDLTGRLEVVLDPKCPLDRREGAVRELAKTRPGAEAVLKLAADARLPIELSLTAAQACATSEDPDVRSLSAGVLPWPVSKERIPYPPISELLETNGDPHRGSAVFRRAEGPNCIICHQVFEEGRVVGPPLTTIGSKLSREQLFEGILAPSASVLEGYENWVVRTTSGDIISGIKVEDTEDHVTLKDVQGEYVEIPLAAVSEAKQLALSIMPGDIAGSMTVQELVDVVEYLSTLHY